MRWAVAFASAALCGSFAVAQPLVAPLESARLVYQRGRGAEACPNGAALAAEVIARLGYDPFADGAARTLEVTIALEGGALSARLALGAPETAQPSTHRLVSTALDCSVLHPALALAIALAIDPARALALDAAPALRAPPAAPSTVAPPPVAPPPRTSAGGVAAPRPRGHGALYAGAYAAVAAGPATTGGVDVGGGVVYRRFSIAAELRGDIPSSGGVLGGNVEVGRVLVGVVPCFRAAAFGICGLASVGVSLARGRGFVVSRSAQAPFVAVGARLLAEIPLARRIALGLHADVLGLLTRLVLRVDATVSYADAPASGTFGLDLIGRFGDGT